MTEIKAQMAEMAKMMNNLQQTSTPNVTTSTTARGRGRGRCTESTRGGAIGGRGRGRGAGATAPKPVAADFLIGSKTDHSLSQPTESSQSRKRNKISPEKSKSKLDTVGSGFNLY